MIGPRIGYIHLFLGNAFTNEYSYYIRDSKWILMIRMRAKSERTSDWLGEGDVGSEGREEPSTVGLTLGKEFVCASFPLSVNWTWS